MAAAAVSAGLMTGIGIVLSLPQPMLSIRRFVFLSQPFCYFKLHQDYQTRLRRSVWLSLFAISSTTAVYHVLLWAVTPHLRHDNGTSALVMR